jgi:hypothetical protein
MENKELVKTSERSPVVPDPVGEPSRLIVAARNPEELNQSHERLTAWATAKLESERADLHDLETNYKIALKNKWRTEHLKRLIPKQKGRIEFYEKLEAALKAGYYIIPEWFIDIFAIRTTRKNVSSNFAHGSIWVQPNDQATNAPALGEGRYVSPKAEVLQNMADVSKPDEKPGTRTEMERWAVNFKDVDFPFLTTARPEIVRATADAMKKLIFDEMGVAPQRQQRGDPIVVGKVCSKEKLYGHRKAVYFMVAWFLDTDEL